MNKQFIYEKIKHFPNHKSNVRQCLTSLIQSQKHADMTDSRVKSCVCDTYTFCDNFSETELCDTENDHFKINQSSITVTLLKHIGNPAFLRATRLIPLSHISVYFCRCYAEPVLCYCDYLQCWLSFTGHCCCLWLRCCTVWSITFLVVQKPEL